MKKSTTITLLSLLVLILSACAQPVPPPVPEEEAPAEETAAAVRITVAETYVDAQLEKQLDQMGPLSNQPNVQVELQDPDLDLLPENVADLTATVAVRFYGIFFSLRPTASVSFGVEDDQVAVSVDRIAIGNVGLPLGLVAPQLDAFETNVRQQLAVALQQVREATDLRLTTITTTEESLTLDFNQ